MGNEKPAELPKFQILVFEKRLYIYLLVCIRLFVCLFVRSLFVFHLFLPFFLSFFFLSLFIYILYIYLFMYLLIYINPSFSFTSPFWNWHASFEQTWYPFPQWCFVPSGWNFKWFYYNITFPIISLQKQVWSIHSPFTNDFLCQDQLKLVLWFLCHIYWVGVNTKLPVWQHVVNFIFTPTQ